MSVLCAILCAGESDPEVTKHATFKLNGMRNFLHSNYSNDEIVELLRFLLQFSIMSLNGNFPGRYFEARTLLSDDARSDLLHWVAKEMADHLDKLCLEVADVAEITVQQQGCSTRLLAATLLVVEKLSKSKSVIVGDFASRYISLCLLLLEKSSHSVQNGGESDISLRKSIYHTIEVLLHRFPTCCFSKVIQLVDLCFRLLDRELEDMIPRLIAAMGSLRLSYEACSALDPSNLQSVTIGDIMNKARASAEPMKRVTSIQWTLTVFGLRDVRSIETVLILLDDSSESVANTASIKMGEILTSVDNMVTDGIKDPDNLFFDKLFRSFRPFCRLLYSDTLKQMTGPKGLTSLIQLVTSIFKILSNPKEPEYSIFYPAVNKMSSYLLDRGPLILTYLPATEDILRALISIDLPHQYLQYSLNSTMTSLCEVALKLIYQGVFIGCDTVTKSFGDDIARIAIFFVGKLQKSCDSLISSILSIICALREDAISCTTIIQVLESNIDIIFSSLANPDGFLKLIPAARTSLICLGAIAQMTFKLKIMKDSTANPEYCTIYNNIFRILNQKLIQLNALVPKYPEITEVSVACIKALQIFFSCDSTKLFIRSDFTKLSAVISIPFSVTSSASSHSFHNVAQDREPLVINESLRSELVAQIRLDSLVHELLHIFGEERAEFILKGMNCVTGPRQSDQISDDNPLTELICCTIELLSNLCISCPNPEFVENIWNILQSRHLLLSESPNICFSVSEALTRLSFIAGNKIKK